MFSVTPCAQEQFGTSVVCGWSVVVLSSSPAVSVGDALVRRRLLRPRAVPRRRRQSVHGPWRPTRVRGILHVVGERLQRVPASNAVPLRRPRGGRRRRRNAVAGRLYNSSGDKLHPCLRRTRPAASQW